MLVNKNYPLLKIRMFWGKQKKDNFQIPCQKVNIVLGKNFDYV